jgi:tRNA threonylcarbamoyladenosine biosynthesis protein TsaE
MTQTLTVILDSQKETLDFGNLMAKHRHLAPHIWLLDGEMGSGKTTFTQAVGAGLGLQEHITSPTFNLVNEYLLPSNHKLFHFDWYRLATIEELFELGIDDYIHTRNALLIIEWGNRFPNFFNQPLLQFNFEHYHEQRLVNIKIPTGFSTLSHTLQEKVNLAHVQR